MASETSLASLVDSACGAGVGRPAGGRPRAARDAGARGPTPTPSFFPPPPPLAATVTVICNDGRVVVVRARGGDRIGRRGNALPPRPPPSPLRQGTLRGFDQATNLVLHDCVERVFTGPGGVDAVPLGGLHVVRGDNVALVGETDADADAAVDWGGVTAPPLPAVTH
jgi:U6 snRNA-associated Sm-like protein LSm8